MMCVYCDKMGLVQIFFMVLLFFMKSCNTAAKECGFPGTPAHGSVKPDEAAYSAGDFVTYTCHVGYILLGPSKSKCRDDGSWSEDVPVCDDSMTTLVAASSTPTRVGYPAEFAIDRDKEKCTYLLPKTPRWWRIDLGENKEYNVLSVAITMSNQEKPVKFSVYVIEIQDPVANYKRCGSFSGKFGTPTIVLSCADGKGITGHKVHIEDHLLNETYFEICEVEIQVQKDTGYACGSPSRNLYSDAKLNGNSVEYDCLRGYKLQGQERRRCLNSGQWSGKPPVCEPIMCDDLEPFENGVTQIYGGNEGPPLEGAIVIYKCNSGYKLEGSFTRNCNKDGSWSGKLPICKVIRCRIPDGSAVGGVYRMINMTSSVGSLAILRCKGGKMEGDNPYIRCEENEQWSKPEAECVIPSRASSEKRIKPRIVNQGGVIFGMVVAAVMIVVVLVGIYLYDQKRRNNKPEIPSRLLEPPVPPPRPPPRIKGNAFKSAFKGFLNRENLDSDRQGKNAWKTQSLPSNQPHSDDLERKRNSKKALSYGETLPGSEEGDTPDIVEVPHHSGHKGSYSPVPEESENAAVEDVVLDMIEAESNKDSSAKDSGNARDYASVDYEKKRQSRLLKEQDSMESSSTGPGSPLPLDESDKKSRSPTPPRHVSETEEEEDEEEEEEEEEESEESSIQNKIDAEDSRKKKEEEEIKAKEEEERKAKEEEKRKEEEREKKEEEERKAKEEEERKAKEEEEKKAKVEAEKKAETEGSRRRRLREEPPPPAIERPVLRRVRKF